MDNNNIFDKDDIKNNDLILEENIKDYIEKKNNNTIKKHKKSHEDPSGYVSKLEGLHKEFTRVGSIGDFIFSNMGYNEKKNKYDRIIWGVGIGKDCYYKTPAEAFVAKLFTFEMNLNIASNEDVKQKTLDVRNEFLATYKNELLPNEDVLDMLTLALRHCVDVAGEHKDGSGISNYYDAVFKLIRNLRTQEKSLLNGNSAEDNNSSEDLPEM